MADPSIALHSEILHREVAHIDPQSVANEKIEYNLVPPAFVEVWEPMTESYLKKLKESTQEHAKLPLSFGSEVCG